MCQSPDRRLLDALFGKRLAYAPVNSVIRPGCPGSDRIRDR